MTCHDIDHPSPELPVTVTSRRRRRVVAIGGAAAVMLVALQLATRSQAAGADTADPGLVALGGRIYAESCAACHGADLQGQPDWKRRLPGGGMPAPPHDATGHTWHHGDRLLFEITKFGGQAMAPPGFKSHMPGFRDQLSDHEIRAVLAFIKSRWPVEIQAVQRQRNASQN